MLSAEKWKGSDFSLVMDGDGRMDGTVRCWGYAFFFGLLLGFTTSTLTRVRFSTYAQ